MHKLTYILMAIGGLNWLVFGLFGTDVGALFGGMDAAVSRIIYVLVGIATIWNIVTHKKNCRDCGPSGM
jgi:uncharacterized membrane protein YuzA (DUF378 family)